MCVQGEHCGFCLGSADKTYPGLAEYGGWDNRGITLCQNERYCVPVMIEKFPCLEKDRSAESQARVQGCTAASDKSTYLVLYQHLYVNRVQVNDDRPRHVSEPLRGKRREKWSVVAECHEDVNFLVVPDDDCVLCSQLPDVPDSLQGVYHQPHVGPSWHP
ncbi:hypothetical protein N657DRAFT_330700 [Parathielavia appendiculata]|uniref:Uncharacterized protein n=1 Tax=Parathielavia appendiculata TaxID=2587402 RepID=A0AAN6U228_9PEZI|nr:hypothetical protein N657DRAFT_330700 [Parathielavia appendiculata]